MLSRIPLLLAFALALLLACGCTPRDPDVLVVGTEATFKPMEFVDTETNEIVGFDIDLIKAIGKQAKLNFELSNADFNGLIPGLQSGKYQAAISSMSITEKRQKEVAFSDPYFQSYLVIAVRADEAGIKSFDDLKGKKIGVQRGTTGADQAKKVVGAVVSEFESQDLAFIALTGGSVDAVINDEKPTVAITVDKPGDCKIVGDKLTAESYGIAVPKNKPELLAKINAALKALRADGTYDQLYKKWFGDKAAE
ncbi:MAG: basic amino acid ABC transporter substrate-binding protein [Planctomycetota bacterium]